MDIDKYYSKLDSERFGYKIARINEFEHAVPETVESLKLKNYRLIISKVSAASISFVNTLEQNGFLLKDMQLTFRYDFKEPYKSAPTSGIEVRTATLSDKETLCKIALNSFSNYGHYAADTKMDLGKAQEIYSDWIGRSYDKNVANNILVATVDKQIAGFLSHKINLTPDKHAVGGIGAVDEKFRNRDIFTTIVIAGLNWAAENNCTWVEHNALVTNYPVSRAFGKLGFKPTNATITFHKWLEA